MKKISFLGNFLTAGMLKFPFLEIFWQLSNHSICQNLPFLETNIPHVKYFNIPAVKIKTFHLSKNFLFRLFPSILTVGTVLTAGMFKMPKKGINIPAVKHFQKGNIWCLYNQPTFPVSISDGPQTRLNPPSWVVGTPRRGVSTLFALKNYSTTRS